VQSDNNRFAGGQIDRKMAKRQCKLLKWWLRPTKNLYRPEKRVQSCVPDIGRILGEENEMRSAEDLKNCQVGRVEIPVFQVGNELRSLGDLRECHEDSQGISHCKLGNEMRSLQDLKDYQEGRE
jgi:hypothetical protein